MLKDKLETYVKGKTTVELFPEELQYVTKNGLLDEQIEVIEKSASTRFDDAYMERSDKETEEFLGEEKADFLKQPITYFQTHKNEFLYMESPWFDVIGIDAISFEVDDVFGTYDVMCGLTGKKKLSEAIRAFFKDKMSSEDMYELLFDGQEGVWNINFSLNGLAEFKEDLTVGEVYLLTYHLLFNLAEYLEETIV